MKICSIEGCEKKHTAKGYCMKHYMQIRLYGKILEKTRFDLNEYWFEDEICYIQIYDKEQKPKCIILIDKEDYDKVGMYKWSYHSRNGVSNNRIGYLSRLIMSSSDPKILVDHKNHNRLDNRKENLRLCGKSQNGTNRDKPQNNTSGAKGVSWNKLMKKWEVYITHNRKRFYLGCWENKERAIAKYNMEAKKLFGEFAYLNSKENHDGTTQ